VSGGGDVTVVWVAPEASSPRDDAQRAVGDWARARGLHVRAATGGPSAPTAAADPALADRVEKELHRSREAIAAADADAAERALARAETLLREHPELPQAAWLRAEVNRGWASRFTLLEPRDEQRAKAAWQDADALDGGRAVGIGEVAFAPRVPVAASLTVSGGGSHAVIARLDGAELEGASSGGGVTTYRLIAAPAEHQLVVSLDGEPAFASWLTVPPAAAGSPAQSVAVRVGDDDACSASSLAGVSRDGAGAVVAPGVTCDLWVAALPAERRGAVLVSRCSGSSCGPFVEWRSQGALDAPGGRPIAPHAGSWPGWATWTALGVGAAAATTITLIATGVFESRPTEQRFIAGGVRVE
jgi:hypothetical protein